MKLEIEWEERRRLRTSLVLAARIAARSKPSTIDGREFLAKRVPLPARLRLGYHEVRVVLGAGAGARNASPRRASSCARGSAQAVERRMAGVALSLYGLRSGAQLGMRRFHGSAAADRCVRAGRRGVHRAESAARDRQSPAVQHQPLPAAVLVLSQFHLSGCREDRRRASWTMHATARSRMLRASEFVEYERVARAEADGAAATLSTISWRPRPASTGFRCATSNREGALLQDFAVYCALDEDDASARSRTSGCGPTGREEYRDPRSSAVTRVRRRTSRATFCFSSSCNGRSIGSSPRRRRTRSQQGMQHRPVSRSGAGHRSIRRRSVGASAVLRRRLPRGRAARRFFAQRAGLGLSAAQSRSASRQRLSSCSRNPSARTRATAARCASIT